MWSITLDAILIKPKLTLYNDFSDALDKLFYNQTDKVIFIIKNAHLELPIAYGLSDLLETIVYMLENIAKETEGKGLYGFPQNDFFDADWNILWNEERLVIEFDWRFVKDKNIKDFPKKIIIAREQFLESWGHLLTKLITIFSRKNFKDSWDFDRVLKFLDSITPILGDKAYPYNEKRG